MFLDHKFILASSSKSRFKILKNVGLTFTKINPTCNENLLKKILVNNKTSASKISLELARLKSKNISSLKKNKLTIGSDTIVSFGGQFINKAKSMKDAKKVLLKISAKQISIYSSISAQVNEKEVWFVTNKSQVKIRKLNEEKIDLYLKKAGKEVLSSVGCFQVEKLGPNIIEEINGDFFNVMGFPLFSFLNFLQKSKKKQTW